MTASNSGVWWLTALVAMGISLGLTNGGYPQDRRNATNRPSARKASDQSTSSKPPENGTGSGELADDDFVKDKPANKAGTKKKKTAGSSKSARGKSSGRPRSGRAMSDSTTTTMTAGGGGGFSISGEL